MTDLGIRSKILLLAVVPTISIAIVMGLFYVGSRITDLNNSISESGRALVQSLAQTSEYGVAIGNRRLLERNLKMASDNNETLLAAVIYDRNNRILASSGAQRFAAEMPEQSLPFYQIQQIEAATGQVFRFPILGFGHEINDWQLTQIEQEGSHEFLGYVSIMMSQEKAELQRYQTILTSILILILGALLGGFLAQRMARMVTVPIVQMAQTVNRIKEGNLEVRSNTHASGELLTLEAGINNMAETLQETRQEMQQYIDQATADLNETLETLEIKNMELDMARRQALEASRVKTEFLANMSHEIRTPMNSVIGYSDLLMNTSLSEKQKEFLFNIRQSASSLLSIIANILDFSKIEAGKMEVEKFPFELRECIDEAISMLGPNAAERSVELVAMVYSDVPHNLIGDPVRIKQILTNLINNAVKFTEAGSVEVRAELDQNYHINGCLKISVTDTGIGMTNKQRKTIFQAFNQADTSTTRRFGGTGLGLVISKALVEKMGGEIGVESEVGEGSTFWFTLPVEVASRSLEENRPTDFVSDKKVYVFDAHSTNTHVVSHILSSWHMDVQSFASITDLITALKVAKQTGKDLQLVIVGGQRLKRFHSELDDVVRLVKQLNNCQLLALVNSANPSYLKEIKSQGFNHSLIKPVTHRNLYNSMVEIFKYPAGGTGQAATGSSDSGISFEDTIVLAVDDNPSNLRLVTVLLENLGVTVDAADSGMRAVMLSKSKVYDAIFMDIQMPEMDGIEATKTIRAHSTNKRTPIIALTAHALAGEREALLEAGLDDYMTKPISQADLLGTMRKWTLSALDKSESETAAPDTETVQSRTATAARENLPPSAELVQLDWSLCLEMANNNEALGKEMLTMLKDSLPQARADIADAFAAEDYPALLQHVHKLHGATCYTGVPRLKALAHEYETLLKREQTHKLSSVHQELLAALATVEVQIDDFLAGEANQS